MTCQSDSTPPSEPCLACKGSGMVQADEHWQRTCRHCFGSGITTVRIIAPGFPQAIDNEAYKSGVATPDFYIKLQEEDAFWATLGGDTDDPWGDKGEIFRERAAAAKLGIGLNIYADMLGEI